MQKHTKEKLIFSVKMALVSLSSSFGDIGLYLYSKCCLILEKTILKGFIHIQTWQPTRSRDHNYWINFHMPNLLRLHFNFALVGYVALETDIWMCWNINSPWPNVKKDLFFDNKNICVLISLTAYTKFMPELPTIARTFNVAICFRIKGIPVVHWVKRRPAQLAVPSSIAGGGNFSFVYVFFFWQTVFHYYPPNIMIWLKYYWKGHKITNYPSIHFFYKSTR